MVAAESFHDCVYQRGSRCFFTIPAVYDIVVVGGCALRGVRC